jgi:BASS family bile acid:Na+ symporter
MDIAALDQLRIVLDPLGQAGIGVALMLVMFSVALGLRVDDFTFLLKDRIVLAGGIAAQVLGLPLVTLALVHLLAPPASVALGMFVVACCPGGAASNLLTYLARGNVAYSVSLTAVSSLLAALLTPASILFWSQVYGPTAELLVTIDFSPWRFLGQTTLLLAIPITAGMIVGARAPDLAGQGGSIEADLHPGRHQTKSLSVVLVKSRSGPSVWAISAVLAAGGGSMPRSSIPDRTSFSCCIAQS